MPDVRKHLLRQDVVLVEDGSLVNLLAVWRAHGMQEVLTECWEEGIVLTGSGAGSQVWHAGGPTRSLSDQLEPYADGLGLLPFSNGVHHDSPRRLRAPYRRMVARGELPPGYATEDGVGLHFVGTAARGGGHRATVGAGVAPAPQRSRAAAPRTPVEHAAARVRPPSRSRRQ